MTALNNKTTLLILILAAALFGVIYIELRWYFVLIDNLVKFNWLPFQVKQYFFDRTQQEILIDFISPVRGIITVVSLMTFLIIFLKNVDWKDVHFKNANWKKIIFVYFILFILITPVKLGGISFEYANTSVVLFTKLTPINNGERFLLPALAHLFFFRGEVFYYLFSLICNFFLVAALVFWFHRNNFPINVWELVSIGTISFISFQFMAPGYPDVLITIFVLLIFIIPITEVGLLIIFVLSLATHEGSVFIWVGLAYLLREKVSWYKLLLILLIYIFFRFLGSSFDLSVVASPKTVAGWKVSEWLFYNFDRQLIGWFFAFKLGWVLIFSALFFWLKLRSWENIRAVVLFLLCGFAITLFAIDTSRLMGWAFPALLISWKELHLLSVGWHRRFVFLIKVVNLIFPPLYVGLNGVDLPPGLYKSLFNALGF